MYIPAELQLAAQFMAAHITGSVHSGFPYKPEEVAQAAIKDAKALIKVFNQPENNAPDYLKDYHV